MSKFDQHWLINTWNFTYSGESTIVPEIALVGEAIAHEPKLALLDVLLDGVEELFFRDLLHHQHLAVLCSVVGHTSSLALVHRGISTTIFRIVCCSLAYRGTSWKGETGVPSFSM